MCSRAPRGDRPEAARSARALAAASDAGPRGAGGAALNKYGKSNHGRRVLDDGTARTGLDEISQQPEAPLSSPLGGRGDGTLAPHHPPGRRAVITIPETARISLTSPAHPWVGPCDPEAAGRGAWPGHVSDELGDNHAVRVRTLPASPGCASRRRPQ